MLIYAAFNVNLTPIEIGDENPTVLEVKKRFEELWGNTEDVYFIQNGKRISEDSCLSTSAVYAVPRLFGGKGGFGSMLRAIGAQIEKTTNREACRDLSGRRLRDINEEKRLKNWIAQQAEREREATERRMKKLERLCAEPQHNFQDPTFGEERSKLTEEVSSAVELGFEVATSSKVEKNGHKRKAEPLTNVPKKKKSCLWVDPDEEDLSSSLESGDSDVEADAKKQRADSSDASKHDSGNEDDVSSTRSSVSQKDECSASRDSITVDQPTDSAHVFSGTVPTL